MTDNLRGPHRWSYALATVICILLGLASRRWATPVSDTFGKYPGDALWAAMVFFALGSAISRAKASLLAVASLAVCVVVETLKLYQAPWIVQMRMTTLGSLVFGHVFSSGNILAYAIGVAGAFGVAKALSYLSFRRQL